MFQECQANPCIRITKRKPDCLTWCQWLFKASAISTAIQSFVKQGSTYLEGTCYLHDPGAGVQRERWNSNICGLAGLCCGLLYGFMGIVQLWKNTTANKRYFLVMRTAGSCWMSVFCCLTGVWAKFQYHNMDFFKNFVLHQSIFLCRWVHGSYLCIIFTLKMKKLQNHSTL